MQCPEPKKPGPLKQAGFLESGAGNEIRTRDIHLGKVVLYQLSYSRFEVRRVLASTTGVYFTDGDRAVNSSFDFQVIRPPSDKGTRA